MHLRSVRHKGLRNFVEHDDPRGIRPDMMLTGDRAGTWSISATGNWRITFRLDADQIWDLDLEDYH